ncbi:MAG: metallophosphoesterase family protein [Candidatus Geothermincolia bacterium]
MRWVKKLLVALSVVLILALILVSATKVQSLLLPPAPRDRNATQLARVKESATGDAFTFAVFGDNKNSYKTFDELRDSIDDDKPLFAIDIGDLVFDGEIIKYRLFLNQVARMNVPLLVAVGNHDTEAGGLANYEKIFGPRYYSFQVANSYFIVLDDSNGKSVDPEQLKWFEKELDRGQDYKHTFVFMHVPPFRGVRNPTMPMTEFLSDRNNAREIKQLCIRYGVSYVFGSHMHTFDEDRWPFHVGYVITGGGGAELWDVDKFRDMHHYVLVSVKGDEVKYTVKPIKSGGSTFVYRYIDEPWTYFYAYVSNNFWLVAGCLLAALAVVLGALTLVARKMKAGNCPPPDSTVV